jgi:hypothetical protein
MVLPFFKGSTMLVKTISALILAGFMSGSYVMAQEATPAPKAHHGKKGMMKHKGAKHEGSGDSMKKDEAAPAGDEEAK